MCEQLRNRLYLCDCEIMLGANHWQTNVDQPWEGKIWKLATHSNKSKTKDTRSNT